MEDAEAVEILDLIKGTTTYEQFKARIIRRIRKFDFRCYDDLKLEINNTLETMEESMKISVKRNK